MNKEKGKNPNNKEDHRSHDDQDHRERKEKNRMKRNERRTKRRLGLSIYMYVCLSLENNQDSVVEKQLMTLTTTQLIEFVKVIYSMLFNRIVYKK